jgi:glutamate formiminotransferase/formiminotetrahydrofolate cyclodeaminase
MLKEMTLSAFIDAVAAKTSVPGGGAVSAAAAAMGAALGTMAAQYSEGPKPAAAIDLLERHRAELTSFIDADAEAYGKVSTAYGLPKKTDDEKAVRKLAIQGALAGAADVPLRAMKASLAAMQAIASYLESVNKNLVSDFAGGVLMLDAGLVGCGLNVKINAGLMSDPSRKASLLADAERIEKEAASLKASLLSSVQKLYGKS